MRQVLLLSLLIFTANQLWAQPANDNWQNAIEIKIAEDGFAIDTFSAPFVSMRNATTEIAETFHPIIRTLALDQKSVWYKFELKTNRKVELKMLQKDTLIQPLDVGMTVYKTNSGAPLVSKYTSYGYPTLTQIGAYTSVFTPGIYYIQVLSRKNVVDSIGLQLTIMKSDLYGNSLKNAAEVNRVKEINFGWLSIDSLAEREPFNLDELTKSAYVKFKTKSSFDKMKISLSNIKMAMVLYEVGIGNNPNDWKIIRVKGYVNELNLNWYFTCAELKPSTNYIIKFLGNPSDYFKYMTLEYYGDGKSTGTDPVNDLSYIYYPFKHGYHRKTYSENYACGNNNALKICQFYKHYLNDTIEQAFIDSSINPIDTKRVKIPIVKTGGWWQLLTINNQMKLTLSGDYLIFKGQATKNICELGPPIDITDKCLFLGEKYTILNLKAPHRYNAYDTLINGNYGTSFQLGIYFKIPTRLYNSHNTSLFYKKSLAQSLGLIVPSLTQTTFHQLKSDTLIDKKDTYIFAEDTLTGKFSFAELAISDSAFIGYKSTYGNDLMYLKLYKQSLSGKDEDAERYMFDAIRNITDPVFTTKKCPPGKYLLVFNAPNYNIPCEWTDDAYMDGYVAIMRKKEKKNTYTDTNRNRCAHPYYAARLAMKINSLVPLSHQYYDEETKDTGKYILPTLCTSESYSTLNNPLLYNYNKYKNSIDGFIYYVFTIDDVKAISISFNTKFQVIRGNISRDSSIVVKNNVLFEYGNFYKECALQKGTYSIIAAETGSKVSGYLSVKKSGYSLNDFIYFAQDIGVLSKTRTKAKISGVHSCKTSVTFNKKDTWHTFQLNQPGRLSVYNKERNDVRIYAATNGNELSFDEVKKQNLVDSTSDNLTNIYLKSKWDSLYFIKTDYVKQRFYIQVLVKNSELTFYNKEVYFQFDPLTTSKGDSCENAISTTINGTGSSLLKANINIHTLGEGPGETNESNLWLEQVERYKTTWFKIEAKNVWGNQLNFGRVNNLNASIYRVHYGSCNALTPGAVAVSYLETSGEIELDCISDGNYYVQVFNYKSNSRPNITFPVEIKETAGPCRLVDINKVLANFTSEGGCPNTAVNFTNLSTWGDNMKYIWDFGDGTIDTINPNPIHKYPFSNTLDTYSVQLIAVNKISNRSDTIIRQIVVGQLDASIVGDTLLCDSKGEFYANSKNLAYSWYTWHNSNNTIYKRDLGVDRYLTYYGYEKENWLYLDAKLGNCIQTDSLLLYSARNLNYTPNGTVFCPNDKQLLFVNPLLNAGYTIKDGANNIIDSMVIKKPGIYKFQTYIDGKKCLSNLQFQVDSFIKPSLIDSPLCYGEPIAKNLLSSDWYFDSSGTTYNRFFKHNRAQNEYYYKYIRRDSVCSWQYDTLRIKSFIDIPVEFHDTILCADDSLKIDLTKYDLNSFSWYNSSPNDTIKIINETGRYMLQMTKDECRFADTFIVTKEKDLSIHLANQQLCFQDEEANLNITDFDSLYWSNGSNDTEQIFSKEGTYWLQAFKSGCVVSDTFTLTNYCEPKLFIPNAFSPNGDADNPVFIAKGDKIQKFQMRIYNRDGALIFYTDDINEGWDGRIKNLDAPMASYYYVVEYSTEQGDFVKSGNLLLLR